MAAQCGPFVSSSVYYGYVQPTAAPNNPEMLQQQQQQQTNNYQKQQQHNGMEVDCDAPQKNQFHQAMFAAAVEAQEQRSRKRGFDALPQDFDYEAYVVPRFKKFREGDWLRASSDQRGLAQVYHEPLLRLSPAADCDMACQPATGNLKFQSAVQTRTSCGNGRCQELEDMLLMTHGCSSYHHYRDTRLCSQPGDSEEAEF
ncbi:uncharacterized protein LOC100120477 isoform X2 [Nasonia vitripennis]|uniref:Uncharacterized protein n=1 Tax=Nasonia vitripennis TaxID=7425 RepID=A0A7M7H2B3_NASVI|nr:uncharacterized protein LOC100120477 isoform X2 [Nasonia vitripennis]